MIKDAVADHMSDQAAYGLRYVLHDQNFEAIIDRILQRRRAWEVLQELRKILTDLANREIPPPKEKIFQAKGVLLKRMLRVYLGSFDEKGNKVR